MYHLFNTFNPVDESESIANSVDPDETAHNEPSHQDLHCLPSRYLFYCAFDIFRKVVFLLGALHRRSKFATICHDLMQNHLS